LDEETCWHQEMIGGETKAEFVRQNCLPEALNQVAAYTALIFILLFSQGGWIDHHALIGSDVTSPPPEAPAATRTGWNNPKLSEPRQGMEL
jgi:hypothetical protein